MTDVALAVERSIWHHQFIPPTIVDGSPYNDWGATVTVRGLDARIYWCFPLRRKRARPSWSNNVKWDSKLNTQCLQCLTISSEFGGSSPRADEERRWNACPWPFGLTVCLRPPCIRWCGQPVSQLHRKIFLTHPCDTTSILVTSRWE